MFDKAHKILRIFKQGRDIATKHSVEDDVVLLMSTVSCSRSVDLIMQLMLWAKPIQFAGKQQWNIGNTVQVLVPEGIHNFSFSFSIKFEVSLMSSPDNKSSS